MLEIRPNCEMCDKDLPPEALDARICSHECTYCADCVDHVLHNVCPNCGGGLSPRPVRPAKEWRPGEHLAANPASTRRRHTRWSRDEIDAFSRQLREIPPNLR
ncbi:MAG: DUF1272 domain-containing protein [Hyphomicrobiaceae bacterium]|nr:DUF1272 domain-containing protein [Hyphomicrobiaceae bacterium]MCC0024157.1 DUF1272 domain-containing protein [Hyphomicrobiaceae bacterium]